MADAPQNSVTRDDLRDALAHSAPRRRPTGLLSAQPAEPREEPRESMEHELARHESAPHHVESRQAAASEPAWDWDAAPSTADRLELEELREVTAEQRRHIDELVEAHDAATQTERELRAALTELAGAGMLRRRAVVAGLRARGLV